MHDRRALSEIEVSRIQRNFYAGLYDVAELDRLLETIYVHRKIIREVLDLFKQETPLRRVSVADPIRNSQLAYYRELAALEDQSRSEEMP